MTDSGLPGRRQFLGRALGGLGGIALSSLLLRDARTETSRRAAGTDFAPRAKRAIWLTMAGAPSQLETFDYKPGLTALYDTELPPSVRGEQRLTGMTSEQARFAVAPSMFGFAQGGASGAWVCDLLPRTREIVDELTIVRSVHTESINHDPAMFNINTGSELPGKPALGAWLSYGLGSLDENVPAFVVMTSRFSTTAFVQALSSDFWSSGFLPVENAGVSMRGSGDPVLYLDNPPGVSRSARRTMLDAVRGMNELAAQGLGDPAIAERTAQYEAAFRMQASVPTLLDVSGESAATLALYGSDVSTPGTFAANCLRARRMMEGGVRFVQIYHRGWDAHFKLPDNHRPQCADIDQACYGLITDLKQRGLLEDTLVIWGGEFGRTVYCQGDLAPDDYGRDHHPRCFTMWLAGGGMKPGLVYGETDDFSYNIVKNPVHRRDLHATVLHQFGLDHNRLTFNYSGLEQKLVGVEAPAKVVTDILA